MLHRDVGSSPRAQTRMHFRAIRNLGLALTLAMVMAACSPTVKKHGHRIDAELISSLVPGVTSKEQVIRSLGSPSSIGTFEDRQWYYIAQRTERVSFYQSEITEQDVITLKFDENGILEAIQKQDLDQARAIQPSSDKTKTLGKELSLFEQLIGNIGRFSDRDGSAGGN